MTHKTDLIKEAKGFGIDTDGLTIAELETAIKNAPLAKANEQLVQPQGLPEPAESLPVEVTTEPNHVAANDARFDENDRLGAAPFADDEILNPGEEEAAGNGNQDPAYRDRVRELDASSAVSAQMVTNAEAGIFNEPPPLDEPTKRRSGESHLSDRGTGAGGPADSVG